MKSFLNKLLSAQDPTSSKRLVGLLGALSLMTGMLIYHTDVFVYSVLILSSIALAITSVEKIVELIKQVKA